MSVYYNELDPYAAAWLRQLIADGLIADGEVDERSIESVQSDDLRGFKQCHFFAGIGGWPYALRLAGWPDDRPVWTGSCPCQPFSAAGKGGGKTDARHLWPQFRRLIRQCRPAVVFGEQVASKAGRVWLSGVFADLEALAYRTAGADLCGPSVGAWDIRQRLWFVADTDVRHSKYGDIQRSGEHGLRAESRCTHGHQGDAERTEDQAVGNACGARLPNGQRTELSGQRREGQGGTVTQSGGAFWSDVEWLACSDGALRPTEPGLFPLAYGVSGRVVVCRASQQAGTTIQKQHWYNRVGALRGFGNAIKPQVAAAFIEAYDSARTDRC